MRSRPLSSLRQPTATPVHPGEARAGCNLRGLILDRFTLACSSSVGLAGVGVPALAGLRGPDGRLGALALRVVVGVPASAGLRGPKTG